MGFLSTLSAVAPPRAKASAIMDYNRAFWSGDPLPNLWMSSLSAAGVNVTPDLAMTLSAYYCGVTTIANDLATLPLRAFKNRADGGKDLINGSSTDTGGIGGLIYRLQWQPNARQSAAEFFVSQIAQFLLRNRAYAEIVPGPSGFLDQLLPRHPDRVEEQMLSTGRVRYKLTEANGQPRYVTQDEMHVVRDLTTSGTDGLSRVAYAAGSIGTALAAERSAGKFFQSGMMAGTLATYAGGQMEDEAEEALHKSISRFAAGIENSFGLMLVPDDVKVSNLAIEPEKAQMMLAREWTVYEVARQLRIQPRKLMVGKSSTYTSSYQDGIDHVVSCLRPIAVVFQQAIQRDLVLMKDLYSFVYHLGELLKGDPAQMGDFIQKLIASRAMTPSEVRMTYLDMNPDEHLDQLSEGDNRPGSPKSGQPQPPPPADGNARLLLRACLAIHDNAVRCCRRERAAIEKLAKKHAADPVAWKAELREFYGEHAGFVAQTMRIPLAVARGFVAEHGTAFEAKGVTIIDGEAGPGWEREEAEQLASLAVAGERAA